MSPLTWLVAVLLVVGTAVFVMLVVSGDGDENRKSQERRQIESPPPPTNCKRVLVTGASDKYVDACIGQVASVHRLDVERVVDAIFVYNLGLSDSSRERLVGLERVYIMEYPKDRIAFPEQMEPKQFAYKYPIVKHATEFSEMVFWLDSGAMFLQDPKIVFDIVERDDVLLVMDPDHFNKDWTHEKCVEIMNATEEELEANQLSAGISGWKRDGRYAAVLDETCHYSSIPECVRGPHYYENHPKLRGHRHDQSILSILRVRHSVPVQPLAKFGEWVKEKAFAPDNDVVIYVHRRSHIDHSGLRYRTQS